MIIWFAKEIGNYISASSKYSGRNDVTSVWLVVVL